MGSRIKNKECTPNDKVSKFQGFKVLPHKILETLKLWNLETLLF